MKYKVGDKVKIVSLHNTTDEYGYVEGTMLKIGETDVVSSFYGENSAHLGDIYNYHFDDLELIEDVKPNTTTGETEMNEVKVETTTPKFKKGDIVVRTGFSYGYGRILEGNHYTVHSCIGTAVYLEGVYDDGELDRFGVGNFDLVKSYEEQRNYRNMKPTDLIKVSIDGFEDEIPLGDLIHTLALVGNSTGMFGYRFFKMLNNLDKDGVCENIYDIETSHKQRQLMKDFFVIEADKANLKELISNKQNELKELQDKLNQLN